MTRSEVAPHVRAPRLPENDLNTAALAILEQKAHGRQRLDMAFLGIKQALSEALGQIGLQSGDRAAIEATVALGQPRVSASSPLSRAAASTSVPFTTVRGNSAAKGRAI